jgi:hypothetical protein
MGERLKGAHVCGFLRISDTDSCASRTGFL